MTPRMIRDGIVAYHEALEPFLVPIDSVQPHPENDNNGDMDAIDESIETNGMYRPVIAQQSTGNILAGNHTWMTLAGKGCQQVPVVFLDVDDHSALRILLGDNRIAAKAIRDNAATLNLLMKLADTETGLTGTGFDQGDLAVIKTLAQIPFDNNEYGQWPTLSFTVHPRIRKAFKTMTKEADTDPEAFELLLRLAGWDGR